MINGKFVCFGNTAYVKNRYGGGYKITVKKGENFDGDMDKIILQVCDKAVRVVNGSKIYDTFQVLLNFYVSNILFKRLLLDSPFAKHLLI